MQSLTRVLKASITSGEVTPSFTKLFIGGEWRDSVSGATFDVINPATEELDDVDLAVDAASYAFKTWKYESPGERSRYLYEFAELLSTPEVFDQMSALEALDNGKPYEMVRAVDTPLTIQHFKYFAGWADKLEGKTLEMGGDFLLHMAREPVGVCGQIIPWNFPLLMFAWKVAPALACGNTIVMKSADLTPLTAAYAAELFDEIGLPPGVLNVLSGPGEQSGEPLALHEDVSKVSFTGSTDVGKKIMGYSADSNLKSVSLELGGKSPMIVFDDVPDLEAAVNTCMQGCFFNQGQVCCASTRVLVHEDIYEDFLEMAEEVAANRVVGDPFDPDSEQGPQVSKLQMEKILRYCKEGKSAGAKLVTGGKRIGKKGWYVEPTIFADVTADMSICREEIFGPVVSVMPFSDENEALIEANNTTFGLAAGVLTADGSRAIRCANKLEAGNIFDANLPFGGYKMSGFGKDSSTYALRNFSKEKAIVFSVPGLKDPL